MKYLKFLMRTRGLTNTFNRAIKIFQRFGVTDRKVKNNLIKLSHIAREFDFQPSLPATAIILKRYPSAFIDLQKRKIEFAIHGLYHRDFSQMPFEQQYNHMKQAIMIFKENDIHYNGFRAPYLSWNKDTIRAVRKNNFVWDSNKTILWNVLETKDYHPSQWNAYKKILKHLYKPLDADIYFSLPRDEDGLIEIPVSIPDDEIITDRLGITDKGLIENIWRKILEDSYQRGELFTMQLHHERVPFFSQILRNLLISAKKLQPPIWIASLSDIATWWKEKLKVSWNVERGEEGTFHVKLVIPDRASVLLKNIPYSDSNSNPFNGYIELKGNNFILRSELRPLIGVSKDNSTQLSKFLLEEGWLYEISDNRKAYGLYLECYQNINPSDEKRISAIIDSSDSPLIRIWRWPNGAKSALSVTGDIDCLTLIDFFMRFIRR